MAASLAASPSCRHRLSRHPVRIRPAGIKKAGLVTHLLSRGLKLLDSITVLWHLAALRSCRLSSLQAAARGRSGPDQGRQGLPALSCGSASAVDVAGGLSTAVSAGWLTAWVGAGTLLFLPKMEETKAPVEGRKRPVSRSTGLSFSAESSPPAGPKSSRRTSSKSELGASDSSAKLEGFLMLPGLAMDAMAMPAARPWAWAPERRGVLARVGTVVLQDRPRGEACHTRQAPKARLCSSQTCAVPPFRCDDSPGQAPSTSGAASPRASPEGACRGSSASASGLGCRMRNGRREAQLGEHQPALTRPSLEMPRSPGLSAEQNPASGLLGPTQVRYNCNMVR